MKHDSDQRTGDAQMTAQRILIIEDDDTFSAILARSLSRRGYPVSVALTAAAAEVLARTEQPDWVVLDMSLAGASGLGLIPRLREINPQCRIVVLTGYASITTAVDAIKLGAVQYLAKPVDVDALLRAFDHVASPERSRAADDRPATLPPMPMSVERLEWEHIQRILNEHQGNISSTARALNMHRRTLQRKLAKKPVKS
jgi:two-component system response regulator RegA